MRVSRTIVHLQFSPDRNTLSPSLNSYSRSKTFPRESQRTAVCSNKLWCSAPISSHRMEKRRDFNGRAFMKWTMSTAPSSTSKRSFGKVLATSASLWRKQCVVRTFWFCALILLMKPLTLPVIAAAPSVQILIQFFQLRPPCSRYSDVTRYISSLVVLCGKHLQNQKFSRISPPSTNLTNPKSCAWPLTSVDSSTCKENFPHSLIFSKTTSSMSADMSLIRLPMVEFESGTFAISLAACFTSCTQ